VFAVIAQTAERVEMLKAASRPGGVAVFTDDEINTVSGLMSDGLVRYEYFSTYSRYHITDAGRAYLAEKLTVV
jgi:hypothetical protein